MTDWLASDPRIRELEFSDEPIDKINLEIVDCNAWIDAANKRLEKANMMLEALNLERGKADPPLPAIPVIAPLEPVAWIVEPERKLRVFS
jgi:hypothetical protein